MSTITRIKELESKVEALETMILTLTLQTKETKTKTKKTKKAKDPDAPKRPLTAYNLFVREMKTKEPKTDMKELGRMWKEDYSDKSDRTEWNDQAAAAKKVYEAEMEAYKIASAMPTSEDEE